MTERDKSVIRINNDRHTINIIDFLNTEYAEESLEKISVESDFNCIQNLQEFLEKANYALKVDGEITVTSPNQECYSAINQGKDWVLYSPKSQYYQLNGKFCRELLIQQGFFVKKFTSVSTQFEKLKLLNTVSIGFPHLTVAEQDKLINELDVMGYGERIIVTATKRGKYKGRKKAVTAEKSTNQNRTMGLSLNS